MGVPLNLQDIQSGFLTASTFNENNTLTEQALAKALDRTSNADDNALEVDLDMGLNKIFNLEDGFLGHEATNLSQVQRLIQNASSGLIARLRETRKTAAADQTVFNLSDITYVPGVNNIQVYVNGVAQVAGIDFEETDSTTITFFTGLEAGDAVDVYVNDSTTNSTMDAQNVTYGQSSNVDEALDKRTVFVESVAELEGLSSPITGQQALVSGSLFKYSGSEWQAISSVSVKSFGAVGDGVTDDTSAIHAALDFCILEGVSLYFNPGDYRVTSGYAVESGSATVTMFGDERRDNTSIILDSLAADRFFYDYAGGVTCYLTVQGLSFKCKQNVIDSDFFRFSNSGLCSIRFKDVIFQDVDRPIVFKFGSYSENIELIGVAFNDSGTIHSDSNSGSLGNLVTLIDVNHNGTVPENSAKRLMDLQGFRGIQATNLLLQGLFPSSGWTVLHLDNQFDVPWTHKSIMEVNGFWSEWSLNPPRYVLEQKNGKTAWYGPAFNTQNTANGTQQQIRLTNKAQMYINTSSFVGGTLDDTLENMFVFENSSCHAILNSCMIRYISSKSNKNFTFSNCSFAADGTAAREPVASALFGNVQSAAAMRWSGGYLTSDGGSFQLVSGSGATPSVDPIYGRKYVISPDANNLSARFFLKTRGVIDVGDQFNIVLRLKLPTFLSGSLNIEPLELTTSVLGGQGYDSSFSGQTVTLNISRRLSSSVSDIGLQIRLIGASGVSGDAELYTLGFYVGNNSPRFEFLQSPTNITTHSNSAPSAGEWLRGDRVLNNEPAVGQPKGWICTLSGTPGTWVSEGNL